MAEPYYQDDFATIYHGDALEVLPTLGGIACTITSPPYNTLTKSASSTPTGIHKNSLWSRRAANGYADDRDEATYLEWQVAVAAAVAAASAPSASFFYNHKIRYRDMVPLHPIDIVRAFEPSWVMRQEVIWFRQNSMVQNARMFPPAEERIYWMVRDRASFEWVDGSHRWLSVWPILPVQGTDTTGHPCPYPEEIPKRCILATTAPGGLVLDPFAGSGTTLRVAKDLGRKVVGIELEERYCEQAARRMGQEVLDFGGVA